MKNIRIFLPKTFHFLVGKFSVYLNRRVFVMYRTESQRQNMYLQTCAPSEDSDQPTLRSRAV